MHIEGYTNESFRGGVNCYVYRYTCDREMHIFFFLCQSQMYRLSVSLRKSYPVTIWADKVKHLNTNRKWLFVDFFLWGWGIVLACKSVVETTMVHGMYSV